MTKTPSFFFWCFLFFLLSGGGSPVVALKKKTRIWSTDVHVVDSTPIKLVARLQWREWLQWKDLSGKSVAFYLNETLLGHTLTDAQGMARFLYEPPSAGNWEIRVSFSGDPQFKSCQSPKNKLRVSLAQSPKEGYCPQCLQYFQTLQDQCLRCKQTLIFFKQKQSSDFIRNSQDLPSQIFLPFQAILGLTPSPSTDHLYILTPENLHFFDGYDFQSKAIPKNYSPLPQVPQNPQDDSSPLTTTGTPHCYFASREAFFSATPETIHLWDLKSLLQEQWIRKIRVEAEEVWVFSTTKVFQWDRKRKQLTPFNGWNGLPTEEALDLLTDPQKNRWVAKSDGLWCFLSSKEHIEFFPLKDLQELFWQEGLILRTSNDLLRFQGGQFQSLLPPALQGKTIRKICFQKEGSPVYLLEQELYYEPIGFLSLTGSTQQLLEIESAFVFKKKNLWLATRLGLVVLQLFPSRLSFPLEEPLSSLSFDTKGDPLLLTPKGTYSLQGNLLPHYPSQFKQQISFQEQLFHLSEKALLPVFPSKKTPYLPSLDKEKWIHVLEYEGVLYSISTYGFYRYQHDTFTLLWKSPIPLRKMLLHDQSLFLGTEQGVYLYSAQQLFPLPWTQGYAIQDLAFHQNALWIATPQGVQTQQGQSLRSFLPEESCLQLLSYADKLYIRTSKKLYSLNAQLSLTSLPLKGEPLGLGQDRSLKKASPVVLTSAGFEFLNELEEVFTGSPSFLLPLSQGFLALYPRELVLCRSGEEKRKIPLPQPLEGALELSGNRFLLWNFQQKWFLLEKFQIFPLDSLDGVLNNPIFDLQESQGVLYAQTLQGAFQYSPEGWQSLQDSKPKILKDNLGKSWTLHENTLIGPQGTFKRKPALKLENFLGEKKGELWFLGKRTLVALKGSHFLEYPLSLHPQINDVFRDNEIIYYATAQGLFCWEQGQNTLISKEQIQQLGKDSFGNLWGTGFNFLLKYSPSKEIEILPHEFTSLLPTTSGQLYFITSQQGVKVFNGSALHTLIPPSPHVTIRGILPHSDPNSYWVYGSRGLFLYRENQWIRTSVRKPVFQVKNGTDGLLWVASSHLLALRPMSNVSNVSNVTKTLDLEIVTSILLNRPVSQLYVSPENQVFCVFPQGIFKVQGKELVPVSSTLIQALPHTPIASASKRLWTQTYKGVHFYDFEKEEWSLGESAFNENCLELKEIQQIFVFQNTVFFSHPDHPLYSYHPQKGVQKVSPEFSKGPYQFWISQEQLLLSVEKRSASLFQDGRLISWPLPPQAQVLCFHYPFLYAKVNTLPQKVYRISNQASQLFYELTEKDTLHGLYSVPEGLLLVSQERVVLCQPEQFQILAKDKNIYSAAQDQAGQVFFLDLKGMYRYEQEKILSIESPLKNPQILTFTPDGEIVVAGSKQLHFLGTNYHLGKAEGIQGDIQSIQALQGGSYLIRYLDKSFSLLENRQLKTLNTVFPLPAYRRNLPLIVAPHEGIWYLKEGELFSFTKTRSRRHFFKASSDSSPPPFFSSLISDKEGALFALSNQGIYELPEGKLLKGSPEVPIVSAALSLDGTLYCATSEEVAYVKKGRYTRLTLPTLSGKVLELIPTAQEEVLVVTSTGLFSLRHLTLSLIATAESFGKKAFVKALSLAPEKILVADSEKLYQLPSRFGDSFSLPHETGTLEIVSLEGYSLWATSKGLFSLNASQDKLEVHHGEAIRFSGNSFFSTERELYEWQNGALHLRHPFSVRYVYRSSSEETLFFKEDYILSSRDSHSSAYQISSTLEGSSLLNAFTFPSEWWIVSDQALIRAHQNCFQSFKKPFQRLDEMILLPSASPLSRHKEQHYLLRTDQGVYSFRQGQFVLVPFPFEVRALGVFQEELLLASPDKVFRCSFERLRDPETYPLKPFLPELSSIQKILVQGNRYWFFAPDSIFSYQIPQNILSSLKVEAYDKAYLDPLGRLWLQYPNRLEALALDIHPPVSTLFYWRDFYNGKIELFLEGNDYFYETPASQLMYSYRLRKNAKEEAPWSSFSPSTRFIIKDLERQDYLLEVRAKDSDGNIQKLTPSVSLLKKELIFQNVYGK